MRWIAAIAVLAACGDEDLTVRGPVRTYALDGVTLPTTRDEAKAMGCDIDGNGVVENRLGSTIADETQDGNITPYVADVIGSGELTTRVTLQAEDLDEAPAAVRYLGHDAAPSTEVVGRFAGGRFTVRHRGGAVVRLPIFIDADVSQLQLNAFEISLDPDGAGGFDARVCGGIPEAEVQLDGARAIAQMVRNNPDDNPSLIGLFDVNKDGVLTTEEVVTNTLYLATQAGDVVVNGQRVMSLGFRAHLAPCPDGICAPAPAPTNRCYDRIVDGDETDVDCGGSCIPCADGLACSAPTDCASDACAAGACGEATCSDGVRDGFESDVDCGWGCDRCTVGKHCERAQDCLTGVCGDDGVCH